MNIFRKTVKYSKPSKSLDNKIKSLDEQLIQTGVISNVDNFQVSYIQEGNNEIVSLIDDINVIQEEPYYSWRDTILETDHIENEKIQEQFQKNIKISSNKKIVKVENYISENNRELIEIRDQIFSEISKNTLLNLPEIREKISKVLEIYDKIQENLLSQPPDIQNEDPLTPLDQNFVTIDELNNHYKLFINRIQQQLSTIGGGGETKLKYLDDVVGIATNPSQYDGKFLKYDHNIGKFVFDDSSSITVSDIAPLEPVQGDLWYDSTLGRTFIYYVDQDGSQWVDASPAGGAVSNQNTWVSTGVGIHTLANVGIGTTNPTSKLTVYGGDIRVGINTSQGVILTSPNGITYRLIVDDSGALNTVLVP